MPQSGGTQAWSSDRADAALTVTFNAAIPGALLEAKWPTTIGTMTSRLNR